MALNAPNSKDTQDVQFKLHDKFVAFRNCGDPRSNVKLLAVSSSRDLLFAGNPTTPELKVILIKDVIAAKTSGKQPLARRVALAHIPNHMSCSSDGNLLAINYTQPNGTSLLLIYAVQSFMTPEVRSLYNIRLAPEDFVHAVQLLWNPVLPNSLAVVLSNGGLGMYTLKEGGNFELHTLDKSQQVKCGCWSPKGKQLVLGFPNGRLQQFKPDLTPAKTLVCPPNVHDAPFDTIAVHWLSTFQFAVIFLQHGEDCNPSLYIINAPKAGVPTYTNYYDICYSLNGPRNHQFHFTHIQQWNLLLVSSANGVEVGVLGTTEAGDTPTWEQLTLLDEARIEMPLSEATQDETFPLGFVFDTSATHQLTMNEQQLPSMPMIHVLATDGTLLSFNFLNLQPGAVSICSPPPPLTDTSAQFYELHTLLDAEEQPTKGAPALAVKQAAGNANMPALSDISFAFTPNTVTSTPAPTKDKPASLFAGFGNASSKAMPPPSPSPFGVQSAPLNFTTAANPTPAGTFSGFGTGASAAPVVTPAFKLPVANAAPNFANMGLDKTTPAVRIGADAPAHAPVPADHSAQTVLASTATTAAAIKTNNSKPLYTVQPTFTPVAQNPAGGALKKASSTERKSSEISNREVDAVIGDIIGVQISAFSEQIEQQKQQTKALITQIESPSSIKFYAKRLDDLQEVNDQANDVDFELDVQGLRHALSEAYAMMAECRAKLEVYRNPDITRLMSSTSFDAAGRRVLARLQSYLAANEAQLRLTQQHIDTQWEQYQDVLRRNSKSKMNMPCLEGIYQRLTRLQNLASDQRIKHTNIKVKLKDCGLLQSALLNQEINRNRNNEAVDTLADSILSMSLNQVVETNRAKLSLQKLQSIRQLLQHHKIQIISPQRPDRVGLKSEVILETKLKAEQKKKAAALSEKPETAHKSTQAAVVTKPTASKLPATAAASSASAPTAAPVAAPAPALAAAPSPFSFSQSSSPFSKTTSLAVPMTSSSIAEIAKPPTSVPGGAFSFSFGQLGVSSAQPALSFGGHSLIPKPPTTTTGASNIFAGFGVASMETTKPKLLPEQQKEKLLQPMELKKEMPMAAPAEIKPTPAEPVKSTAAPQTSTLSSSFSSPIAKPTTSKPDTAVKPFSFSGFGSNTGSTIGTTPNSSMSFGGFGASLGNSAAPKHQGVITAVSTNVTPTVATTTADNSSAEKAQSSTSSNVAVTIVPAALGELSSPSSVTGTVTSSNIADPIDNAFGSINICKPNVKDNTAGAPTSNIFSGFSTSTAGSFQLGDSSKGLFGGSVSLNAAVGEIKTAATEASTTATVAATAATAATTAATVASTAAATEAPAALATAVPAATIGTVSTTAVATTTNAATVATTTAATFAATIVPTASTGIATGGAPGSSFSFSNAFSSLSTASNTPAGSLTATNSAASTASNASSSIFGGAPAFAPAAAAGTGTSPFQAAATSAVAAAPAGNIFGNVPKPEASVFGAVPAAAPPPSGLFAAAAASTSPSPFAGSPATAPAATSGGNIFGQSAVPNAAVKPGGFGLPVSTPTGGSIFGGASSNASLPFGGSSIFGGSNSAQSSPAAAPTGSIFGQSVFGSAVSSSGGNLFNNSGTAPTQSPGFGGGSVFGSNTANTTTAASGGSIFGGGSSSGGFGSFAQASTAAGGFGSGFAQATGSSVAQSGFGSPQQQTAQSPASGFGAKPVFGGSPAFGASPTFGGGPTFGSPKGFGAFGNSPNVVAPPAFGAQPKPNEGNIFETLGGTDTGLSFGNLAQTGNTNAQKSTYGGSSFMNYR